MTTTTDLDKQVAKVILGAMKQGKSEATALRDAGFLNTPEDKINLIADAFENVAGVLNDTQISQILPPGVPMSAADIKRYIADWLIGIAETNRQALKR